MLEAGEGVVAPEEVARQLRALLDVAEPATSRRPTAASAVAGRALAAAASRNDSAAKAIVADLVGEGVRAPGLRLGDTLGAPREQPPPQPDQHSAWSASGEAVRAPPNALPPLPPARPLPLSLARCS